MRPWPLDEAVRRVEAGCHLVQQVDGAMLEPTMRALSNA
jgi:hypothetical protein